MRRANLHESAFEDPLYNRVEAAADPAGRTAAAPRVRTLVLRRILLVFVLLVALPYFFAPIYDFPAPQPFAGPAIWNPYAGADATWLRANLHAHGTSWGGITNGQQADEVVVDAYRRHGYDVPVVSDYHRIAAFDGVPTLPAYEHGYNIAKTHQLALGARGVFWIDFPLFQWTSQKQYVIDGIKSKADLVAIVHPSGRNAYTDDDLRVLTNYDLFEVMNGRFPSEEEWDTALSSGHFASVIANDDTHDVTDPHRMAVAWTMIDAGSAAAPSVIAALRAGRSYAVSAVSGTTTANDAVVSRVDVQDGRLTVGVTGGPATFTFIRQNGEVRRTVEGATSASYDIAPDDQYVRTTIRTPRLVMFLNPVIRWDGSHLPSPAAHVDLLATWLLRIALAIGCAGAVLLLGRRRR
jgi:hypothetical protein